jgi:serine/threonine-protein kinase
MAEVGRVLGGRYALVEVVGQGGMATIYRGRDTKLGRDVAIKVLRGEYGTDASFLARFQREAQAAAQLNHPNVVAVFDYGQDPAGPYIVMELVTGGDLAAALRERGPLPPTVAASIGQQVADALDAAHARGIVHRDIKPSNVLLSTGGRVKVADFGIAQAFTDAQLTMTGVTMGSVHYFSPEQARGEQVTTASDIYSTGLVLYEMLTGQRAYTGGSAAEVAMARLTGRIPSPMEVRPDVPAALDAVVRWCLQPEAQGRPSASELAAALGRFLADPYGTSSWTAVRTPPGTPIGTLVSSRREEHSGGPSRIGWAITLVALFVVVVAAVLLFLALLSNVSGSGGRAGESVAPSQASPVVVPRFVGMPIEVARRQAVDLSLVLDESAQTSDTVDPGVVIDQDPTEGRSLAAGGVVRVVVAQEVATVAVPDVRGDTPAKAERQLVEAGLRPSGQFQAWDAEVRKGRVVFTEPAAATEVAEGTTVALYVSRGPRPTSTVAPAPTPIMVGNYTCLDLDSVLDRIEQMGLVTGAIFPPEPRSDGTWLVKDQSPGAGAEVQPGTVVRLWVSDPAEPCG